MKRERSLGLRSPEAAVVDTLEDVIRRHSHTERLFYGGSRRLSTLGTVPSGTPPDPAPDDDGAFPAEREASPAPETATSRFSEGPDGVSYALGGILYDFARVMQRQSSRYDAFDILYRAVAQVREHESAVKAVKRRRFEYRTHNNVYHQLISRRMGRSGVDPRLVSQQLRRASRRFQRAANVWGHHCCLDEIDPNKPYNEPPQVRCIRFDNTGDVLITGGDEGVIKLWHTFNCTLITSLRRHAGGVVSMDVHPNNLFILSCCDGGEMWLWEINGNLYRPHKRITSQFKYLWCRFSSSGGGTSAAAPSGFSERCAQEIASTLAVCVTTDSKLSIYRMADMVVSSSGNNIVREVAPLYTVELFNHNIKAYDISRPLMHDNSSLIALGIEPTFLEELRLSDDAAASALALLQNEPGMSSGCSTRGKYGKISSTALCALFNVSTGKIMGIDALGANMTSDLAAQQLASPGSHAQHQLGRNSPVAFCTCDLSAAAAADAAGNCRWCLKRVRKFAFPHVSHTCLDEYPLQLKMESSPCGSRDSDASSTLSRPAPPKFLWNTDDNELEVCIRHHLESYSLCEDTDVVEAVRFGPSSMPFGRYSSTLVFPSYMDNPCVPHETADGERRDPGNFDDLIYHVQRGHDLSPDVCFANHSLNHVTGSDDGKLFLWVHCGPPSNFKSTPLFTKCLNKWLSTSDSASTGARRPPTVLDPAFTACPRMSTATEEPSTCGETDLENVTPPSCLANQPVDMDKTSDTVTTTSSNVLPTDPGPAPMPSANDIPVASDTQAPNPQTEGTPLSPVDSLNGSVPSNFQSNAPTSDYPACYAEKVPNLLRDPDVFRATENIRPSMMGEPTPAKANKTAKLFKEGEVGKQPMSELGHHYVVTAISWSFADSFIFIADSIVTRYNVKKLITASRTILSGVSVFTPDGLRVADFLHNDISHHVGCVKPHPVSEDLALAITYGGLIYILSIRNGAVVRKLDCGGNAVWLDADWHPSGMYFAACQSFGCFSLFALEALLGNYHSTLNHQCGFSDLLPINTSAFYSSADAESVDMRRYYYGSTLMPPVELEGKSSSENLRLYTASAVYTVLDDSRYEVFHACSPVAMQIDDSNIHSNRLRELCDLPDHLARTVSAISRIPLEMGVVEFLQWHLGAYGKCDLAELLIWYLCINNLHTLVDFSHRIRRKTCPYGGVVCIACHYISTTKERAERYVQLSADNRGVKSKVNERGDIIGCLPISARPQPASGAHAPSTSVERRAITSPPAPRIQPSTSSGRAPSATRSQPTGRTSQSARPGTSSRPPPPARPPPTRVQPPRGQVSRQPPSQTPRNDHSSADESQMLASPVSRSRTTPTRSPSQGHPRTPPSERRGADATVITASAIAEALSTSLNSDERTIRRLRREMRANESEEESTPERSGGTYSFRNRRDTRDIARERDAEQARKISTILGPLGLSKAAILDVISVDCTCVLCGLGGDTSRSKRGPANRVCVGGSSLAKNTLIGPFAATRRFLDVLGEEMPKVFDRLGSIVCMHVGCLAAATHLEIAPSGRKIANFPEVMAHGLHSKCAFCGGNFATLHCDAPGCGRRFHFPCAVLSFSDESYQRRQPTAHRNPSFLTRMNNSPDPLLCDRFLCLECTLKSWVDGSPSLEPYCTGELFLTDEPRAWFYPDSREDHPVAYVPQGGELVLIPPQAARGRMRANTAAWWMSAPKPQLLELKKLDYRFYGPVRGSFGVCAAMSLRQVEDNKRVAFFYYTGGLTVLPLTDLLVGLWRLARVSVGDSVRVLCASEWKDAVVRAVKAPLGSGSAYQVVKGDLSAANVAEMARAAMDLGTGCIQVDSASGSGPHWVSAWEFYLTSDDESALLAELKERLFPAEAKEQLINLTLDPAFEVFNILPSCSESSERWVRVYWQTVANPMSLEKVRQRILNSYYTCPQGCIADLDMIVRNCRFFNSASASLCQLAQTLERAVSQARDELRRLMNADKYIRAVVQRLWQDIEPFFDGCDASAPAPVAAPSAPNEGVAYRSALQVDTRTPTVGVDSLPDDLPFRRSPRLLQVKALPSSSSQDASEPPRVRDSRQKPPVSQRDDPVSAPAPEGGAVPDRRSSRLAQLQAASRQSSQGTYSRDSHGAGTAAGVARPRRRSEDYSRAGPVHGPASPAAAPPGEYLHGSQRRSSRLAAQMQELSEREKRERQEREREAKVRRLHLSHYNLRER
ncbi:WD repeat domain-containing protein, putative [Babesia caballi]|uniref:WD repeat domain-containing protein, putative n=1 Tax=Babesia caballi TaxID=5871 RepID=A0AAV4M4P8_BABCB|nr:WD repeat domain-containing protein, putative [Babesia caballi]